MSTKLRPGHDYQEKHPKTSRRKYAHIILFATNTLTKEQFVCYNSATVNKDGAIVITDNARAVLMLLEDFEKMFKEYKGPEGK